MVGGREGKGAKEKLRNIPQKGFGQGLGKGQEREGSGVKGEKRE